MGLYGAPPVVWVVVVVAVVVVEVVVVEAVVYGNGSV